MDIYFSPGFDMLAFDWPGMQLSATVVVFAASLPHAVVRNPVGSFYAEYQVLNEGNLYTENTHHTTEEDVTHGEWTQFLHIHSIWHKDVETERTHHSICSYTNTQHLTYSMHIDTMSDLWYWSEVRSAILPFIITAGEVDKNDVSSSLLKVKLTIQLQTWCN